MLERALSMVLGERAGDGSFVRSMAARWGVGGVWLVVICAAVYLPGMFNIPPVDRDESRFAQASRQMFESVTLPAEKLDAKLHAGGWAVPMVGEKPRLNKPPMIYWLQTISAWVFTLGRAGVDAIWMYRVPSALCALASVLLTWRLGLRMFDARVAWVAGVMVALSPMVAWDAHQARADQLLLLTVVAGQYCLWRVWSACERKSGRERARDEFGSVRSVGMKFGVASGNATNPPLAPPSGRGLREMGTFAVLFWVCMGLGVLSKGPITIMISALTVLALGLCTGRWRWVLQLRPIVGFVIVLAMVLPWVMSVAAHIGGIEKYWAIVWDETIGRSTEAKESHWGPPGYHTFLAAILLWPGSIGLGVGIWRAIVRGLPRRVAVKLGPRTGDETVDINAIDRVRWWQRRAGRSAELFLLCWIVPAWVVFEIVSTKLPHYTMPMIPALALLCARGLFAAELGQKHALRWLRSDWGKRLLNGWALIGVIIAIAILITGVMPFFKTVFVSGWSWLGAIVAGGAMVILGFGYVRLRRGDLIEAWAHSALAALLLLGAFTHLIMPAINGFATRINSTLVSADPSGTRPIGLIGYHEDSLIFLTRGRAQRLNTGSEEEFMSANPDGLMVLPADVWEQGKDRWRWSPVGGSMNTILTGFNYSRGKSEKLVIIQRER